VEDDEPRLFTRRLELIAATPSLARAGASDARALAAALQAEPARGWPLPPFADEQARELARLTAAPSLAGWLSWYVVQVSPARVVGTIGFAGPPDGEGAVEIAYAIAEGPQRRGYATEAMGALIDWAFSHSETRMIVAHAAAADAAAIRVIEDNGLRHVGPGRDGQLRFMLARP